MICLKYRRTANNIFHETKHNTCYQSEIFIRCIGERTKMGEPEHCVRHTPGGRRRSTKMGEPITQEHQNGSIQLFGEKPGPAQEHQNGRTSGPRPAQEHQNGRTSGPRPAQEHQNGRTKRAAASAGAPKWENQCRPGPAQKHRNGRTNGPGPAQEHQNGRTDEPELAQEH